MVFVFCVKLTSILRSYDLRPGTLLYKNIATYPVSIGGFRGYLRNSEGLGYMRVFNDSL